jgi:cell filamentation protein
LNFEDPYLYPGTAVLRNKLDIRDAQHLDRQERSLVVARARCGLPAGNFDLTHLQEIHRHLFQDVYDWAGQLRTVEISKGGSQFLPRDLIERGMDDVHRRLREKDFLRGLGKGRFADEAGRVIGDVNYVHPFREGNGRAQLQFLRLLGEQAGHRIDLTAIDGADWIKASRAAHDSDYSGMSFQISRAVAGPRRGRD